jgi:dienelactone hydrolase
MLILIATEIWGRTPHVDALAESLRPAGGHVTIIDPYAGADPGFRDEDEAYAGFLEQCGHEAYAHRVRQVLRAAEEPVFLAGFSAGAGAVWSAVCALDTDHARHAACFYGSAIRTMADLVPRVPVDMIFPAHEPRFDVLALADALGRTPLVDCHVVPEGHGFMNPLSTQYDESAARHWTAWLKGRIESVAGRLPAAG